MKKINMIVCTGKINKSSNVVCRFSFSWSSSTFLQEDLTRSKFMVDAVFWFPSDFVSPDRRPSPALWWGSCRWLCHVRICAPETIHGSEWHRSPRSTSSPSHLGQIGFLEKAMVSQDVCNSYSGPQFARIFQTSWGRSGKQQQEQNSPNLGPPFSRALYSVTERVCDENMCISSELPYITF